MATLRIVEHPDSVLNMQSVDLAYADIMASETQTLIEDMMDTCHSVSGLGLAANQVGHHANLCIYQEPGTKGFKVLINPTIKSREGKMTSRGEGCLSLPGKSFDVKRFKKITVEGLDRDGNPTLIKTKSKQLAKILQHEIDHLSGITLADKKGAKHG